MTAPPSPVAARRSRAAASASLAGSASSAVDGAIRPQPVRVTVLVDMARNLTCGRRGDEASCELHAAVTTAIYDLRRAIDHRGLRASLAGCTGNGVHCRSGGGTRRQQQDSDGRSRVRTSPRDGNAARPETEAEAYAEAGRAARHHLAGADGGWRCGNRGGLPRPGPL